MSDHHEKFGNQEIGKRYHLQAQKKTSHLVIRDKYIFLLGNLSQNLPVAPVILTKKLAFSKSFC